MCQALAHLLHRQVQAEQTTSRGPGVWEGARMRRGRREASMIARVYVFKLHLRTHSRHHQAHPPPSMLVLFLFIRNCSSAEHSRFRFPPRPLGMGCSRPLQRTGIRLRKRFVFGRGLHTRVFRFSFRPSFWLPNHVHVGRGSENRCRGRAVNG